MAVGEAKLAVVSKAAGETFDIKPAPGEEWVVHNLYWNSGNVEVYRTDGTNALLFDKDDTQGGRLGVVYHVTVGNWLQVKNTGTSAILIGYDGVQTR